jgi:uridine kinase
MSRIIAVAAPIGGGKTTLVKAIAQRLDDAAMLFYDHYEKATQMPPRDLVRWMNAGADFNAFTIPGLAADLKRLQQGQPVNDPVTGIPIEPQKYTILEMPLGRAHRETAKFINLLVWIDVPLDMALARKIKAFARDSAQARPEHHRERMLWLDGYLNNYLQVVRGVLRLQAKIVRGGADVIIDGQQDVNAMTAYAVNAILGKLG